MCDFICRDGCAMVESWDSEEPHYKNKGNSLCRNLFGKGNNIAKEQNPYPFKRVFKNEEYCVLKVWTLSWPKEIANWNMAQIACVIV